MSSKYCNGWLKVAGITITVLTIVAGVAFGYGQLRREVSSNSAAIESNSAAIKAMLIRQQDFRENVISSLTRIETKLEAIR